MRKVRLGWSKGDGKKGRPVRQNPDGECTGGGRSLFAAIDVGNSRKTRDPLRQRSASWTGLFLHSMLPLLKLSEMKLNSVS